MNKDEAESKTTKYPPTNSIKAKKMKIPMRKFLISNPKDYYPHNYYNSLLIRYNEPALYLNLLAEIKNKNKLMTNEEISLLGNKPFHQTGTADIRKRYGKSNYHIKSKYPISKEIFFYRLVIGKRRVNLELHFHDNELFFYNYSFPYLKPSDKTEIIKVVESKYLNGQKYNFKDFNITDSKYNIISINENAIFTISYICFASAFFEELSLFLEKQKREEENEKRKEIENLYEKL